MENDQVLDALIIGAGFSGLNMLLNFRKLGFSSKIYENGSYLGGTWFWNRYPGARVDSDLPVYQLMQEKEIWNSFDFKERFPGREELMRYFRYIDEKLEFSKDITYNTFVTSADFDDATNLWNIGTDTGLSTYAKHLILCIGFQSKSYTPPFNGLEKFKGEWYHSSSWPEDGVNLTGKRVAIVGTGASGVQIIQEIGPEVAQLTVYQRTPNLALPMRQHFFNKESKETSENPKEWQCPNKADYESIFSRSKCTFSGFMQNFWPEKFENVNPTERQKIYEDMWMYGGFAFWLCSFGEVFFSQEANNEAYAFWANKTRERLHHPIKRELLAPLKPPHAWGTKRPCLETSYYEVFNQNNVDLIDVNSSPIIEVTEYGIKTKKEGVIPVDIIIFATGFDSFAGGFFDINIRNAKGISIQEKWKTGTKTYLSLCTSDLPNLFWVYGPHSTAAFGNGPTSIEIQCNWITDLLLKMHKDGQNRVAAIEEPEAVWTKHVNDLWQNSLFPATNSWYQGANIPGKIRGPLHYMGGIPLYYEKLNICRDNNYEGFSFV